MHTNRMQIFMQGYDKLKKKISTEICKFEMTDMEITK